MVWNAHFQGVDDVDSLENGHQVVKTIWTSTSDRQAKVEFRGRLKRQGRHSTDRSSAGAAKVTPIQSSTVSVCARRIGSMPAFVSQDDTDAFGRSSWALIEFATCLRFCRNPR